MQGQHILQQNAKEMSPRAVYKHGEIRNFDEYSFFLNER